MFDTDLSYQQSILLTWEFICWCFQKAFTTDNRIAWTCVTVTQQVFDGEVKDDWYPLTGKQGEDKEGMINLLLSYQVC